VRSFGADSSSVAFIIEVLRRPRDYVAVKRALAEAGYKGEKIVVIVPTDVSELGNLARTGAEQLRRAGMNIDQQDMDAGSWFRRRVNQAPPDKGGHNMFCTLIDRSLPNVHPLGNLAIRADGKEPINGWANSPRIEELRAAWLDTNDLEQQKRICVDLQKRLWADVPFIPLGEYWQATAYRKDLTDVLPGCFATFYGVRRA
jgi:peptide/nickel transport system substrate-binding protein